MEFVPRGGAEQQRRQPQQGQLGHGEGDVAQHLELAPQGADQRLVGHQDEPGKAAAEDEQGLVAA